MFFRDLKKKSNKNDGKSVTDEVLFGLFLIGFDIIDFNHVKCFEMFSVACICDIKTNNESN